MRGDNKLNGNNEEDIIGKNDTMEKGSSYGEERKVEVEERGDSEEVGSRRK